MSTFSRRDFLRSATGTVAALELTRSARALGMQAPDVCALAPEQEVGPYYVTNEMIRRDIRENRAGFPLLLELALIDRRTCKPLVNAAIDVWHCDALGLYSGYTATNPKGGEPPANKPTDKLTFLRGVQLTDERGRVRFETVFPGFYMGRVNHVHFKVRLGGHLRDAEGHATYLAGRIAHVGQMFFPEDVTADLMKLEPYSRHQIHRTTQKEDMVYQGEDGNQSLSGLKFVKSGSPQAGLRAELALAVDPDAIPSPAGPGRRTPPTLENATTAATYAHT